MTESIPRRRSAPILLVASGLAERRAAVVAQLQDRYASDYDVVSVATSAEAAEALRRASDDGRQVAVLLADDPGRGGRGPHRLPAGRRAVPRRPARPARRVGGVGRPATRPTWCSR